MPKSTERLRYLLPHKLKPTDSWSPPSGYEAHVIGGYISHIAATASQLLITGLDTNLPIYCPIAVVKSTNCTASFSVNPVTSTAEYTQRNTSSPNYTWFDSRQQLYFAGGTGSLVVLLIEVVKIDEYTGKHLA